jgi:hypothetical protein
MSNSYVLVNPYIQGEFENTIKAKNSIEAGREFYKGLSEHFNNAVPKFYFTIQKGGSGKGKYYHFKVGEKRNKNNVSFTLEPYDILGEVNIDAFANRLTNFKNKFAQNGGKKKGSKKGSKKNKKSQNFSESSSDSDSSSDDYKKIKTLIPNINQPFYYWWYDPSIYRLDTYYVPTFYAYVTPVIEIVLNN